MVKPTFLNLPDEKREQIEETAIDEFARHSYAKASLSRIVQRVGIAKGSIYQYFDDKADLFAWLLERAGRKKMEYLGASPVPEPGHFFDWLETVFKGGLRFAMDHPRIARISLAMFSSPEATRSTMAKRARKAGLQYMEGLVREAQRHGEVREDLDAKTLSVLVGGIQNSMLELLAAKADVDSIEALFTDDPHALISDEDMDAVVHSLIEVFRRGAASPDGPKVVAGAPESRPFDLETYSRIIRGEDDEDDAGHGGQGGDT
jgi:AcrR family transcriptional regulator